MPQFSIKSQQRLATCAPEIQEIMNAVIATYDCTILTGYRGEDEQNEAFRQGHSKRQFPQSKHNSTPSAAVDAAPYPIDWNDRDRFHHFAGFVQATAEALGYRLRWGGDWDSDRDMKDNTFDDLVHFELRA